MFRTKFPPGLPPASMVSPTPSSPCAALVWRKKKRVLESPFSYQPDAKRLLLPALDESSDDEDIDELDQEPDRGEILWSEDQEEYPSCAAYHPRVAEIQKRIQGFLDSISTELGKTDYSNDTLNHFRTTISELSKFPDPPKLRIALLGDAGTGKSSLINSILDTPHLAKEGNAGRSCTCVATEYRQPFLEQRKRYAAQVDLLDDASIAALLREHLEEFHFYHFESDDFWTKQEEERFCAQAKTAEDTFSDLFLENVNFNSSEAMKIYIGQNFSDNNVDGLVQELLDRCRTLIRNTMPRHLSNLFEADTAHQLGRLTEPYLFSRSSWSSRGTLWPLVQKVSIGVQGPRLLQYIVFADLPGISDTNQVRARASSAYLSSCDTLWIVTPINRCIDNKTLETLLNDYGERFADRLAIICTKTDDTGNLDELAREYKKCAKPYLKLKKQIAESESCMRALSFSHLGFDEAQKMENAHQSLLDQQLKWVIQIRNEAVRQALHEKKKKHLPAGKMETIYCVSNKHYSWLKGYKEKSRANAAQLGPLDTEIPSLRQYALWLASGDVWDSLDRHITHTIAGSFEGLQIWASSTTVTGQNASADYHANSHQNIHETLWRHHALLAKAAPRILATPIGHNIHVITQHAEQYLTKVRKNWHWSTVRAFARRDGTYTSKRAGNDSWNTRMMKPAAECIDDGWPDLIAEEKTSMKFVQTQILEDFDTISAQLIESIATFGDSAEHFRGFVRAQRYGIISIFVKRQKVFDKTMKNIKQTATKDPRDGYFTHTMLEAYASAKQQTGPGCTDRLINILKRRVQTQGPRSPFLEAINMAIADIDAATLTHIAELQKCCIQISDDIFAQFKFLIDQRPSDELLVHCVKMCLQPILNGFDIEMKGMIAELKQIAQETSLAK